jgi:Protein of unknown function (DUF1275)
MRSVWTKVRHTIAPPAGDRHGPLPPLLPGLTVVTGLVDAFSYLVLGHVFVANMTGNVVFLGFAPAGASGFSTAASLVALGAFCLGALVGGRLATELRPHRGRLLTVGLAIEVLLVTVAVVVAEVVGQPGSGAVRAWAGATLVLRSDPPLAIVVALVMLCLATATAVLVSRGDRPWALGSGSGA